VVTGVTHLTPDLFSQLSWQVPSLDKRLSPVCPVRAAGVGHVDVDSLTWSGGVPNI
jgi:hypothetical protein